MNEFIAEKLCSRCSHMEEGGNCTQYGQGVAISFDHKLPCCNHFEEKRIEGATVRIVPYSESDACWCQPFDGPKHPNCPMHGKPKNELEECLFRALNFLESPLIGTWQYMEGESFYRDKNALAEDIRKTLDIGNAGK
jgi:hypothetical protein